MTVATRISIRTYKFRIAKRTLPPLCTFVSRNPWHPFAELWGSAEPSLINTALYHVRVTTASLHNTLANIKGRANTMFPHTLTWQSCATAVSYQAINRVLGQKIVTARPLAQSPTQETNLVPRTFLQQEKTAYKEIRWLEAETNCNLKTPWWGTVCINVHLQLLFLIWDNRMLCDWITSRRNFKKTPSECHTIKCCYSGVNIWPWQDGL